MNRVVVHIVRGCGTLPFCGEHPGTVILLGLAAMGALAGAERAGWLGALIGAGVLLTLTAPIYLCGAYRRSTMEPGEHKNTKIRES